MVNLDNKWDTRFLQLAREISTWSKDPSTKVGAVIINPDRRVVGVGYNGLPAGIPDDEEVLNNRDLKNSMILHAEENAIINSAIPVKGCTIYTWPFQPCLKCVSHIIQHKIAKVVTIKNIPERWKSNFEAAQKNLQAAGIELKFYEI